MVLPAKLASAKCIAVFVFCLLFVLVFIYLFIYLFVVVVFVVDCLFNWSTEMAVLT